MGIPLFQVDSFAAKIFTGNPAAVCLLDQAAEEPWMQSMAAEMNLSETAFVVQRGAEFDLRWFTPTVEVALCGHATLAAAHVLWESGRLAPESDVRFHTKSGVLTCQRAGEWIEMDFPAIETQAGEAPEGLVEALGVEPVAVGRNRFDYLVEIDSEDRLRALKPDHAVLRTLPVRGVIVTARSSGKQYDFVSRFFAPGSGIDEDPVTGSAHCALAPYWAAKFGKQEFQAYQASARGGEVRVRLVGDRVILSGQARTVFVGEIPA